jgi:hypothetical protein
MAKKPEWWQMLGSPEKMIERSVFNMVGWFVVVVLIVVLTLGDIVFHIFRIEDVGLLKIRTHLKILQAMRKQARRTKARKVASRLSCRTVSLRNPPFRHPKNRSTLLRAFR